MKDSELTFKVNQIKKQFLCGVPVKNIDFKDVLTKPDTQLQELLINSTVNSDLVLKYPIKITYQKEFLKHIIDQIEKEAQESVDVEVCDIVYDAFGRLVSLPASDKNFKHYLYCDNNIISLQEEVSFISSGTTGLCTWTAALALADWCFNNKNVIVNKNVLELGSGVGLTGLAVANYCKPKKIYLTDCHEAVLKRLKDNVVLNLKNVEKDCVEVLDLPWEEVSDKTCKDTNVDIVLAADVVYDPDLFNSLIQSFKYFLEKRKCDAYIVCTQRNIETLTNFLNLLDQTNILSKELPDCVPHHFIWSNEVPVKIFKLSLKTN